MEITCIGMGFDATLMLPVLEKNLPARCLGIASKPWDWPPDCSITSGGNGMTR